jgi:hypothetical protein
MSTTSITKPAKDRQTFVLLLRPLPGVNVTRALRWALKGLLRRYGLRCISIAEEHHEEKNSNQDHS